MPTRKRVCDADVEVLKETNNPAVMWGDCGLLDLIALRANIGNEHEYPWVSHTKVLNALSHCPGILIPGKTVVGNGRVVRIFRMP